MLDHKRSNAINIAMTKLPPPRAIKIAILKMDSTVVTREGIEKLLNMLPTEEERDKIIEAKNLNPELPLGTAEQFLFTLSSISELSARLKLWAFKLDFENIEKEIAEPLMDLKLGIDLLKTNITFKCILAHLLSIGIFLNGQTVKVRNEDNRETHKINLKTFFRGFKLSTCQKYQRSRIRLRSTHYYITYAIWYWIHHQILPIFIQKSALSLGPQSQTLKNLLRILNTWKLNVRHLGIA